MTKRFKTLALATMALFLGATANAQTFSINDLQGAQGTTIEIPVLMNNGEDLEVVSFNFDLFLPTGVAAVVDDYGDIVAEMSARSQKHALTAEIINEAVRFISYSDKNRSYKGSEGEILTVSVKLDADPGTYTLKIGNATMTNKLSETEFVDIDCLETTATLTIDKATGIDAATVSGKGNQNLYNLQGQAVSNGYKGIVILEGKKMIAK